MALVLAMVLMVVACAPAPTPTPVPPPPATTAPVVATSAPAAPTAAPAADPLKGLSDAQVKWLKAAEMGPFAPKEQDWKAIEEAAKKEGKVLVYSASSRIPDAAKSFEAAYPGIKAEGYDLGSVDTINKVKAEVKAGAHVGDVYFASDPATTINEMVAKNMVWNFVPSNLATLVPKELQSPLLVHRLGTRVLIYNSEVYKTSPIKNWWDLTKPEWKGKIQMKDIYESGENLSWFATFIQHSDDFAKAYKDAFGKDIVLDKDCPTAGHQWVKAFLANDPVFVGSDGDVSNNIGAKGQKNPPIGLVDGGKYRDVISGKLFFEPVIDSKPVGVVFYQSYVGIIDQAPHPNAAKLMVRWLTGGDKDGKGYEPWYVPGDYPTRTGVPAPKGAKTFDELKPNSWTIDPVYSYQNGPAILDFWVSHQAKK